MVERLLVATPWYPTETNPYAGSFVVSWLQALGHPAERTTILHVENVPPGEGGPVRRTTTPEGTVVHVRAEMDPLLSRPGMARAQLAALEAADVPELTDLTPDDVLHAHVAMPTGWAVTQLVPAGVRMVLTEHASYVGKIHRTDEGREMYGQVLARAETVLTVSEHAARGLRALHPQHRARIFSLGNPVATDAFPARPELPRTLERWLYVGNLLTTKGVDRVIRAFAAWRGEHDPDARLTLVGGGAHEEDLRELAADLGVGAAVRFAGPVEHRDLHAHMAEADVLVHLSRFETFGLTPIEAAVSGLPVVVTACGGPQETLADAAVDGLVRYVPVSDDVEPVVEAVRSLENALGTIRPADARQALVERYGFAGFGARVREILEGRSPVNAPDASAPTVVALAFSHRSVDRVAPLLQRALRDGARTVLVTSVADEASAADPRTRVIDLSSHVPVDPVRILERLARALTRLPVGAAEWVLQRLTGVGGSVGPRAESLLPKVQWVDRRRRGLHKAVRRRILERFYYSWLDPWRFGRSAMAEHGTEIGRDGVDVIVYGDDSGLPLAWRLAQAYPDADVVGAVSGQRIGELVREHRERKDRGGRGAEEREG